MGSEAIFKLKDIEMKKLTLSQVEAIEQAIAGMDIDMDAIQSRIDEVMLDRFKVWVNGELEFLNEEIARIEEEINGEEDEDEKESLNHELEVFTDLLDCAKAYNDNPCDYYRDDLVHNSHNLDSIFYNDNGTSQDWQLEIYRIYSDVAEEIAENAEIELDTVLDYMRDKLKTTF